MIYGRKLESVGSWIQFLDGMVYPLESLDRAIWWGGAQRCDANDPAACHVCDIELGGDWMASLSDDDRQTVEAVLAWNS